MFWNDNILHGLARGLDGAALRQKVTAQNISNLNTPGYKRSYVSFSQEMDRARVSITRTDPRHLAAAHHEAEPVVKAERHTSRRPDGNNVDLDREMLDMVTNQLRYNALVQQTGERYSRWRYIINEGRG